MTQQPYETETPTTATVPSRPVRVIAVAICAILVIGIGNVVFSVRHRPKPVAPTALSLQQQQAFTEAQMVPTYLLKPQSPPPDPDDFNEARDGSESLSLEDENGKASVWEDKKSGSRIFCLDSCIVLPATKLPKVLTSAKLPKKGDRDIADR